MRPAIGNTIESMLHRCFVIREESFSHDDIKLHMILPRAADELLDEQAFGKDERMPYWADLWPSAKALARWLLQHPRIEGRWIELGCGVGLPSLVLKSRGIDVLATDHNEDALLFARANAQRNGLNDLETLLFDWRDPNLDLGHFDVAIAADVLYEQRNAIALAELLPRILALHASFILADPLRHWGEVFRQRMRDANWIECELEVIEETQRGGGPPSVIQITRWCSGVLT